MSAHTNTPHGWTAPGADDDQIIGRPAVLWQLRGSTGSRVDCVCGEAGYGRVQVRIIQDGTEHSRATFGDPSLAIQWAFEHQRVWLRSGGDWEILG